MKHRFLCTLKLCIGLLLLAAALIVLADDETDFTLASLKGTPSQVAIQQGERRAHHSHRLYARNLDEWREKANKVRAYNRKRVAALVAKAPKPGPGHHAPIPPTQYENLILAFVNPKQQPVAGLQVAATVHMAKGSDRVIKGVTDSQGAVVLRRVGKLPAAVDLSLAASKVVASAKEDGPEWKFQDFRAASILLPKAVGFKVAEERAYPSVRVASIKPFLPAALGRKMLAITQIYQTKQSVVVERTQVDLEVTAPAGSKVTTAALPDQTLLVPASGSVSCHLPVATLADGPVPLRVAADLPGGVAEATVDSYSTDPYAANKVEAPPLRLARLSSVQLSNGIDVMSRREDVTRIFGDAGKKSVKKLPDGSECWIYANQGLMFKLRSIPFKEGKNYPMIVERIRVSSPDGGQLCGLQVGCDPDKVTEALGPPQILNDERVLPMDALGQSAIVNSYLDGGVRIGRRYGKVLWWEIARPTTLLVEGTTAFVPRTPAPLYIASFKGNPNSSLPNIEALRTYLRQVHAIRLVDSRDQADLLLDASVDDFDQQKDEYQDDGTAATDEEKKAASEKKDFFAGLLVRYACTTKLKYSLYDTASGQYITQDRTVEGQAQADFRNETGIVAVIGAIGLAQKNQWIQIITGLAVAGGIEELRKSMRNATNRCPGISARTAFDQMVQDIDHASNFGVRLTDIDYEHNRLTLNVGTEQGIQVSTKTDPYEFEVLVRNTALPNEESSFKANYYTAVVMGVSDHSCVCELHHVNRKVDKGKEKVKDEPDLKMVQQLPDPATGMVSARASVRFPELPILRENKLGLGNGRRPQRNGRARPSRPNARSARHISAVSTKV
jgi:hypothetical protein